MSMTQSYFAISRHVDAPRERIFQAWMDTAVARRSPSPPTRPRGSCSRLDEDDDEPPLAIVTLADEGDHTVMTFEGSRPPRGRRDRAQLGAMLDALVAAVAQPSQYGGNAGGIRPG